MKLCTGAIFLLLLTTACGKPAPPVFPQGELVDLSHTYDAQTIYWPTAEGFRLRKDAEGVTPAGLLLRGEQPVHLRARRHAHRRADSFRAGTSGR